MFTCLCNFSANTKLEIKLHKLFKCELTTKQAQDENVSKYKKEMSNRSKIDKIFGGAPLKSNNTLPKKRKTNVSKFNKLLLVSSVSENINSARFNKLFGGTPINETNPRFLYPIKNNVSTSSELLLVSPISEKIRPS